jgi:tetratricopeptide (TPR) repeat protein
MECGSQETFCHLLTWLTENELAASGIAAFAGRLGENAQGALGLVAHFLRDYGQALVGLFGVSFGFYRWWLYREHILHKRLSQYIAESDRRLDAAQRDLLEAIQRPGPGHGPPTPLFADADLASVLRERRWDQTPLALTVCKSADSQLSAAIERIDRRLQATASAMHSLQKQIAAAHTLRGAIAASQTSTPGQGEFALACFRNALRIPNQKIATFAKELEGHQLRKLGYIDRAASAYRELKVLASQLEAREQAIIIARAKRCLAEIYQERSISLFCTGQKTGPGSAHARDLLVSRVPNARAPGALVLRDNFAPYQEWDLLEHSDTCLLTALVYALLGSTNETEFYRQEAVDGYSSILDRFTKHGWFYARSRRKLHRLASEGSERALAAGKGDYDVSWILPSLNPKRAEEIAARIRAARG